MAVILHPRVLSVPMIMHPEGGKPPVPMGLLFWIPILTQISGFQGRGSTGPILRKVQLPVVGEFYSNTTTPIIMAPGVATPPDLLNYVTWPSAPDPKYQPRSKHSFASPSKPLEENFLFLDGHVEYVEHPESRPEMFPTLKT